MRRFLTFVVASFVAVPFVWYLRSYIHDMGDMAKLVIGDMVLNLRRGRPIRQGSPFPRRPSLVRDTPG